MPSTYWKVSGVSTQSWFGWLLGMLTLRFAVTRWFFRRVSGIELLTCCLTGSYPRSYQKETRYG